MLTNHLITEYKDIVMVGKVFKKNGISLIYGESGTGKTVSTIKAMNIEKIVPILLDFDNNQSPQENKCEYVHVNGTTALKDKDLILPMNSVVIIDTWAYYCKANPAINKMAFIDKLIEVGNTVIIIAHNKGIATKQDIPDMDEEIVNHLSAKLWLERKGIIKKGIGEIINILHIYKCRGYSGKTTILNWMRTDAKKDKS
jgi:archaellum biogenesis ATPase FlaH